MTTASKPRTAPRSAGKGASPERRCLIVGYDRDEGSRRAVSWAASQLAPHGRLVLVHACRPLHAPPSPLSSEHERHELGRAIFDELMLEAEADLLETILETELADTDPVSALTDAAAAHHADGIVVGHAPHSRLHSAIGTVTVGLLACANVPVTIVPPGTASRR